MTLGQVLGMSAVLYGLIVLAAEARFGSLEAGRAWFAGATLFVDAPEFRANYGPEQDQTTLKYIVRNFSDVEIPVVGSSASCSCTVTDGLPESIPARGVVEIVGKVKIDPSRRTDDLRGSIRIYVGHDVRTEIPLSYVLKPSAKRFAVASKSDSTGT